MEGASKEQVRVVLASRIRPLNGIEKQTQQITTAEAIPKSVPAYGGPGIVAKGATIVKNPDKHVHSTRSCKLSDNC